MTGITGNTDTAGKPIVYEDNNARITGSNGEVANGEYLQLAFDKSTVKMWPHDSQNPDTHGSLTLTAGTGFNVASLGTGGAVGEVQMWRLQHKTPFTVE